MKTLQYAIRFLTRSKSYTLINLMGLAFSLACCIILMRYIHRELTVDTHCVDREKVYVLIKEENDDRLFLNPIDFKDVDCSKYQVETSTEIRYVQNNYFIYNDKTFSENVLVADNNYLEFFNHQLIQGSIHLEQPGSAVLTETCAKRIFAKENPIGKIIKTNTNKEVVVTGVIRDNPNKSIFPFGVILDKTFSQAGTFTTLLRFAPNTDIKAIKEKMKADVHYDNSNKDIPPYYYSLSNIKELYWDYAILNRMSLQGGNKAQLGILIGICIVILLTGIMNFVNLYLICMQKRQKEYGLRKIFGIGKIELFWHIWSENLLLIMAALFFASLLLEVIHVPINRLLGLSFEYTRFDGWLFGGILLLLPMLTSLYPFFKSCFSRPIVSLRSIGSGRQSVRNRIILLCIQYVFTFLLTVLALYFNKQLSLLVNTNPGFRTECIMIPHLGRVTTNVTKEQSDNPFHGLANKEVLMEKICGNPIVEYFEPSLIFESGMWGQTYINDWGEECVLYFSYVTPDFFKMFNLRFIDGKLPETSEDEGFYEGLQYVVNEAAMKVLGYTTRKDGKIIESYKATQPHAEALPIRAVIENFYPRHLAEGAKPMIFQVREKEVMPFIPMDGCLIAYSSGQLSNLIDFLGKLNMELYGSADFDYTLLENDVKALYKNDRIIAIIYILFAVIAIIISCLGLFGISLFDIRQRYREIGIRKVNGAGMKDLYRLLFRKYIVVLGIAFIVATPIAYYLIYQYTADFVVKAPIGIGIFVIALLLVALISLGTLFWQIRKAANINPAEVVKSE